MVNNNAIDQMIDDLKSQKIPNYSMKVKKYAVNCTTLRRRFKGETLYAHAYAMQIRDTRWGQCVLRIRCHRHSSFKTSKILE